MERPIIDVTSLIELQKPGRFAVSLLGWTFLCMLLDGFDFAAISFVVPALARKWHAPVGSFGSVFGFGVAGLMVGSIVFGWVGDRIGRRTTIVLGCWLFGGVTLASIWAPSVGALLWLRFLAGVGLYAAVPNAIVLVSEFAPRRLRATWVVLMFTGFTIGAVLAGIAGATLIPRFGWQAMFAVGGVLPFVISIFLWFVLPESVRFLTLREHGWGELRSVIQRMLPGHNVPENARFVIHEGAREDSFTPRLLFAGSLLFITPLLWLFYIFNSAAVFFMQSWMPGTDPRYRPVRVQCCADDVGVFARRDDRWIGDGTDYRPARLVGGCDPAAGGCSALRDGWLAYLCNAAGVVGFCAGLFRRRCAIRMHGDRTGFLPDLTIAPTRKDGPWRSRRSARSQGQ